jgi:hypothetical protein
VAKIKIYMIMISLMLPASCIEEYIPDIPAAETKKYCVYGELTTEREDQFISVALASSIRDPKSLPINECSVRITDNSGNAFEGSEYKAGEYRIRVHREYLLAGMSYRLEVVTPAGTKLVSDFEELLESPEIDSLYWVRELKPTSNPEVFRDGIQFYMDFSAPGNGNAYYKFDVIETYEYHSLFPLEWYYDGTLHHVFPPDYSHMVCWATNKIPNIFILNTAELQKNAFKRYSLQFVDNTSQRLEHLYSLLVRQYSISEESYFYWDQLRANNIEKGGLYETQPLPAQGNLVNLTHPDQSVLGYFQVSSVKTKRIFVRDVPDLEFHYEPDCGIWPPERLQFYDPMSYPIYFSPSFSEVSPECIFCDRSVAGGTIDKPDFWPDTK